MGRDRIFWVAMAVLSFSVPVRATEVVLAKVRSSYPDLVTAWERDCSSGELALSVFEVSPQRRFASAICWNPPDTNGSRTGQWLGTAPFAPNDSRFLASCNESDRACQTALTVWEESDNAAATAARQRCASLRGTLFVQPGDREIEVRCGFFAMTVWDENGDGAIDYEDPVSVDILLGTVDR